EGETERRDEEEDRGEEPRPLSPEAPDRKQQEERRAETGEPRGKTGGERGLSENREGCGVGPVEERRLFEIGHAVQARHDEIVRRQHLAWDLRVPRLVRLREPGARRLEPDRHDEEGPGRGENR